MNTAAAHPIGTLIERPIPVFLFGKDHWSTFCYVETRCVDHKGFIEKPKMRTDAARHPLLAHVTPFSTFSGKDYPTILYGGAQLKDHDDWDCLADLEAAGFLTIDRKTLPSQMLDIPPGKRGKMSGLVNKTYNPKVRMTELGCKVAGDLRAHKIRGGTFSNFIWNQ